jgi:hypothetical protein
VPNRYFDRGVLILVIVWLLVLASIAYQRDGLYGGGHYHLLNPDLSRQMVYYLALAAV